MASTKSPYFTDAMASENIVGLLYDMCRLCLERNGRHSIFCSPNMPGDIAECAGVQVALGDELPELVCEVCLERLRMCRSFRRLAEQSDTRLRLLRDRAASARLSESDGDVETIIPEIVMSYADSSQDEVAVPEQHDSQEHEEEFTMIGVRSDLFKEGSPVPEKPKRGRKKKTKEESPQCDEAQLPKKRKNTRARSQSVDAGPAPAKRKRTAACAVKNYADLQEPSATKPVIKKSDASQEDLVCEVCNKECATPKALYLHRRSHVKCHACETCEKAFSTRGDLAKHVRVHTGERPYGCDICGKRFAQRVTLRQHHKVHIKLENAIKSSRKRGRPPVVKIEDLADSELDYSRASDLGYSKTSDAGIFETDEVQPINGEDYSAGPNMLDSKFDASPVEINGMSYPDVCTVVINDNVADENDKEPCLNSEKAVEAQITPACPIEADTITTAIGTNPDHPGQAKDIISNNNMKPFRCDICNKTFSKEEKLVKHFRKHQTHNTNTSEISRNNADSPVDSSVAETNGSLLPDTTGGESTSPPDTECITDDGINSSAVREDVSLDVNMNSKESNERVVMNGVSGCIDNEDVTCGDLNENTVTPDNATSVSQKPYQCDVCCKMYAEENKLERHKRRHLKTHNTNTSESLRNDAIASPVDSSVAETNGSLLPDTTDGESSSPPVTECVTDDGINSSAVREDVSLDVNMNSKESNERVVMNGVSGCIDNEDVTRGDLNENTVTADAATSVSQKTYQCDMCHKMYAEENKFERHKRRHLKRDSVGRFC